MTTPAEELRAAAERIRQVASSASGETWQETRYVLRYVELADRAHIELWHPGVAELVAQLLEKEALLGNTGPALELARAINPSTKAQPGCIGQS